MVLSLSSWCDSEGDLALLDLLQDSEDNKSQKVYGKKWLDMNLLFHVRFLYIQNCTETLAICLKIKERLNVGENKTINHPQQNGGQGLGVVQCGSDRVGSERVKVRLDRNQISFPL